MNFPRAETVGFRYTKFVGMSLVFSFVVLRSAFRIELRIQVACRLHMLVRGWGRNRREKTRTCHNRAGKYHRHP